MDSTIITINKKGIIQTVDKNCAVLFGFALEELQGQPIETIIPHPYKEQHATYLQNFLKTGVPKIIGKSRIVEGQHKNGTIFPINLSVTKIGNIEDDPVFIGMIHKVEDKACLITISTEGTIIACNGGVTDFFGYSVDEVIGKNVNILMPSPYHENHPSYIQRYLEGGDAKVIGKVRSVAGRHKSGVTHPISLQVEEEVIGNIRLFKGRIDKVDTSVDAFFTLTADGIIDSCNHNFVKQLFGYASTELIGRHIKCLIPDLLGSEIADEKSNHSDVYFFNISDRSSAEKIDEAVRKVISQEGPPPPTDLEDLKQQIISKTDDTAPKNSDTKAPNHQKPADNNNKIPEKFTQPNHKKKNNNNNNNNDILKKTVDSENESSRQDFHHLIGTHLSKSTRKVLRHKDGSMLPVNLEISPFVDSQGITFYSGKIQRVQYVPMNSQESFDEVRIPSQAKIGVFYNVHQTLGRGTYGTVKYGINSHTQEPIAIKILNKEEMEPTELSRVRREIEILHSLHHIHICQLFEVIETTKHLHLIMEYGGDTLFNYVMKKSGLSEEEAKQLFRQILSAFTYCHNSNIIHRDIKHKNILLNTDNQIKVIDFGLSNFMEKGQLRSTFCGTPAYAAPEMILGEKYQGPEVDIWSMGVVLYSMIAGQFPFENVADIIKGQYKKLPDVTEECNAFISLMLVTTPSERATVDDLNKHPWMREENVQLIDIKSEEKKKRKIEQE